MDNNINAFCTYSEITVGRTTFLVERRFMGKRDFKQAIYTTVENEANRKRQENTPKKSA